MTETLTPWAQSLAELAANATPKRLESLDWWAVLNTLEECKAQLERDGAHHSWITPAIDIARSHALPDPSQTTGEVTNDD